MGGLDTLPPGFNPPTPAIFFSLPYPPFPPFWGTPPKIQIPPFSSKAPPPPTHTHTHYPYPPDPMSSPTYKEVVSVSGPCWLECVIVQRHSGWTLQCLVTIISLHFWSLYTMQFKNQVGVMITPAWHFRDLGIQDGRHRQPSNSIFGYNFWTAIHWITVFVSRIWFSWVRVAFVVFKTNIWQL